jgi:hypothetical protein
MKLRSLCRLVRHDLFCMTVGQAFRGESFDHLSDRSAESFWVSGALSGAVVSIVSR